MSIRIYQIMPQSQIMAQRGKDKPMAQRGKDKPMAERGKDKPMAQRILSYQGLRLSNLTSKGRYDETFAGEDGHSEKKANLIGKHRQPQGSNDTI